MIQTFATEIYVGLKLTECLTLSKYHNDGDTVLAVGLIGSKQFNP